MELRGRGQPLWGWLSCEENTTKGHGYVFACPPEASKPIIPQPIRAYGRFRHEAAVVEPGSFVAYLTEDANDAAFYRFVPHTPAKPFDGTLQALAIRDHKAADLGRASFPLDTWFDVTWVPLERQDRPENDLRKEAHEKGAAIIRRGEGLWRQGNHVYFSATSGGPGARGQVFHLNTQTQKIRLMANSANRGILDMPDNLTVAPNGGLIICEDGFGRQFLRQLSVDGTLSPFAENRASGGEFAGACFSPDGTVMFVNMQTDGLTIAIRGPFLKPMRRPNTNSANGPRSSPRT